MVQTAVIRAKQARPRTKVISCLDAWTLLSAGFSHFPLSFARIGGISVTGISTCVRGPSARAFRPTLDRAGAICLSEKNL